MQNKMNSKNNILVGLADADLLDGGTRHPNLALLKLAGFFHDNSIPFELIANGNADVEKYTIVYISKVFTFTKEPSFYLKAKGTPEEAKFRIGGTGTYMEKKSVKEYRQMRYNDMVAFNKDEFLNSLKNYRGGRKKKGVDMARQMPYYHLYDNYVQAKIAEGKKKSHYKDYLKYSIGFLTRGCFRHCPFCVNKLEKSVLPYSNLEWFLDNERDDSGRLVRPFIYLWDDNFLASDITIWKPILQKLIDTKRYFQFRQGLDERIIAESEHGEEIAQMLSKCKYHGDYIFAFDNWSDRDKIVKALKIWKFYNKKETKFYLFCGYRLTTSSDDKLYRDVWEIFQRIKILMQYGCLGYVMRHEDYHNHPMCNIYVQIARWCNQPQFYKKMSFWEFCYRNQTFWEETSLKIEHKKKLKSYEEFMEDYKGGYYDDKKICRPLKTCLDFLRKYSEHKEEILDMFSYKMVELKDPTLWERKQ